MDKIGLDKALKFYTSIIKASIKPMDSIEEAEAVKILENCFRDVNIALVNEFAKSFDKLGIDIMHVIEGASEKPFSFLPHFPGCGVGGHCIPVDPYYMIEYAKKNGFSHDLLKLSRQINNEMPKFTVDLIIHGLKFKNLKIKGAKVSVLGFAYKKNLSDIRESPSITIINLLKKQGMKVRIYDPYVPAKSTVNSLKKAIDKVDVVLIATDHDEFVTIKPQLLKNNEVPILIDGKNCLRKQEFVKAGIYYKGIGR